MLSVLELPIDRMEGEVVAALFFEDVRPLCGAAGLLDWRLNGKLTRLILAGSVDGRQGERVLTPNNGKLAADWVLLMGGGKWCHLGLNRYGELLEQLIRVCSDAGFGRIAIGLTLPENMARSALEAELRCALAECADRNLQVQLSFDDDDPHRGASAV